MGSCVLDTTFTIIKIQEYDIKVKASSFLGLYYELNFVPPNSYVEALPSNMMVLGNDVFGR